MFQTFGVPILEDVAWSGVANNTTIVTRSEDNTKWGRPPPDYPGLSAFVIVL